MEVRSLRRRGSEEWSVSPLPDREQAAARTRACAVQEVRVAGPLCLWCLQGVQGNQPKAAGRDRKALRDMRHDEQAAERALRRVRET
jgi:hypothetical protein